MLWIVSRGFREDADHPGDPGEISRTFNPVLDADSASDAVVRLLFSPLVEVNMESQQAEPGLAESWSVAADQKTWTSGLRRNALRWSDGAPLTADDVVFMRNDVMHNPKFNRATYDLFRSGGKNFEVTKVDDVTVRVVTPQVFAPFLEYFGSVVILPKHNLEGVVATGLFTNAYAVTDPPAKIVGSGPFRVKVYESQKGVILSRNPEYWTVDKQGQRLPYFDSRCELDFAPTPTALQTLFFHGDTAAYENIRPDDAWTFHEASTNGHFKLIDLGVGVQRDFLWFNQNTGVACNGKPFVA